MIQFTLNLLLLQYKYLFIKYAKIIDKNDVFLLDQWGVLHDGFIGYPHAIECVNNTIFFISINNKATKCYEYNKYFIKGH